MLKVLLISPHIKIPRIDIKAKYLKQNNENQSNSIFYQPKTLQNIKCFLAHIYILNPTRWWKVPNLRQDLQNSHQMKIRSEFEFRIRLKQTLNKIQCLAIKNSDIYAQCSVKQDTKKFSMEKWLSEKVQAESTPRTVRVDNLKSQEQRQNHPP